MISLKMQDLEYFDTANQHEHRKRSHASEQIFGKSKRFDYKQDYKHDDGYEHAV